MDTMTNKGPVAETVTDLITPVVEMEGFEVVEVRYFRGQGRGTLRITIDKPSGVTIDDCAQVSRLVGDMLDVHDPIEGAYNLEVSSPGINRPLVREKDFRRFKGEKVYIETKALVGGRRRFKGVLGELNDGAVEIECQDGPHVIGLDQVAKARLDII